MEQKIHVAEMKSYDTIIIRTFSSYEKAYNCIKRFAFKQLKTHKRYSTSISSLEASELEDFMKRYSEE